MVRNVGLIEHLGSDIGIHGIANKVVVYHQACFRQQNTTIQFQQMAETNTSPQLKNIDVIR